MRALLQRYFFSLFLGIALPAEPEVIDAVPLESASLCQNCRVITREENMRCPMCQSEAVIRLAPILNRDEFVRTGMLKVAAISFFEPLPGEKRNGRIDIEPIGTFN